MANRLVNLLDRRLELTARKLTWGNKTMKAAFDEARGAATGANDEPAEADSYEVEDAE